MKSCNRCGKLVKMDAVFCNYCGQAFEDNNTNNDVQPVQEREEKKFSFRIKCLFVFFLLMGILLGIEGIVGWAIVLIACGILMSPPLLKKNSKGVSACVLIVAIVATFMGSMAVTERDEKVDMVKNGNFTTYAEVEIEDAFRSFFSDCEWEYIDEYVEFRGKCYYGDDLVPVVMRFYFESSDTFMVKYLSIDGERQSSATIDEILDIIYESYYEEQGV